MYEKGASVRTVNFVDVGEAGIPQRIDVPGKTSTVSRQNKIAMEKMTYGSVEYGWVRIPSVLFETYVPTAKSLTSEDF